MKSDTAPASFEQVTVSLAQQLRADDPLPSIWKPDDLKALFLHQLQTRLKDEALDTNVYVVVAGTCALEKTIEQILLDPRSPVPLLMALKNYARWLGRPGSSHYPSECASALYYCVIAAAWLHTGERMTSLSTEDIRDGLAWTARQDWVPDTMKIMLHEAIIRETT